MFNRAEKPALQLVYNAKTSGKLNCFHSLFRAPSFFSFLTIGFVFRHHQTLYTFSTPFPSQTEPYVYILLLLTLLLQLLLLITPDLKSSLLIWIIVSASPKTTPSIYVVPTFEKVVNRIAGKITHLECWVLHPNGCRLTGVRPQLCTGKKLSFMIIMMDDTANKITLRVMLSIFQL